MHGKRRLEGAKFVLLDCDRREIMCVKTDDCGEAFIDCIPFGRYFLVEIEPPCGYVRYSREIEIVISESCPHRYVEVIGRRKLGSLNILKTED